VLPLLADADDEVDAGCCADIVFFEELVVVEAEGLVGPVDSDQPACAGREAVGDDRPAVRADAISDELWELVAPVQPPEQACGAGRLPMVAGFWKGSPDVGSSTINASVTSSSSPIDARADQGWPGGHVRPQRQHGQCSVRSTPGL
jgi:hypothetical protein